MKYITPDLFHDIEQGREKTKEAHEAERERYRQH